ncbi:MAG: hypothetical protein QMD46_02245 [Methanomicrobiales archaeon]|nr:hypothetical protein [Methanomicrobiales archaeon]
MARDDPLCQEKADADARIRRAVVQTREDHEDAVVVMWLDADTNLRSGEDPAAIVRTGTDVYIRDHFRGT